MVWCRKCRRFSKNFFCGGRGVAVRKMQNNGVRKLQNIGLLWAKVRMFYIKSTDVCLKEVRCFCFPERVDRWTGWPMARRSQGKLIHYVGHSNRANFHHLSLKYVSDVKKHSNFLVWYDRRINFSLYFCRGLQKALVTICLRLTRSFVTSSIR